MGLNSKLVSSDGRELDQEPAATDDQKPTRPASVKRPLPRDDDRLLDESEPLKCPRCESTNTKFCYYNNYNKSQPRHFCKACKRHWTKGGTLRNVPIGGNRKNKRLKAADPATTATSAAAAALGSDVVAKDINKPSLNFGDSVFQSVADQEILNSIHFPVPSLSDSVLAPMNWHAGIGQGAAASAFWGWEDIESLVSSTSQGFAAWDDYYKVQLP